jgi:hypothetical protein
MTTQITTDNIQTSSVYSLQGPRITSIQITDSSYVVLDDTAVSTSGGYIKITGTGFTSGSQVLVNSVAATSTTFVSAVELRAQLPATAAGTYILYVTDTNGGLASKVNGITFSSTPTWVTGSTLTGGVSAVAYSLQLSATSDSTITYTLQAGSTLPTGLSLSSSGLLSGTVTVASDTTYSFTITATDAELQDSPRTFSLTIVAIILDSYFKYVPLLLNTTSTNAQTNNTFLDASTNNFTITRNGTPTQGSVNPYWPNGQWSNYFDSTTTSFLTVASTTAFNLVGNFTLEAWVNPTTILSGSNGIIDARATAGTSAPWYLYVGSDAKVTFFNGSTYSTCATAIVTNVWTHVAVVRSGSALTIYLNGVADFTNASYGTASISPGTTSAVIGTKDTGVGAGYRAITRVSNVRVVVGTAVYTGTFTPPTSPLAATQSAGTNIAAITGTATALLTCQSNRFLDNSTNNFALTTSGTPQVQAFQPFSPSASYTTAAYGGSGYYSGTSGEYLNTVANAAFSFGTSDFTVEGWVYPTGTLVSNNMPIVEIRNSGGGAGFVLLRTANALTLNVYTNNGFAGASTNSLTLYAWNHVALVRNSNVWYYYINGVASGSFSNSSSQTDGATVGPKIGGSNATAAEVWFGYLSNIRIVKGTAVYTGAFTPPTLAPLTTSGSTSAASYSSTTNVNTSFASSATSLLLNYTNAGIYDAAVQNNEITVGSAQASTTVYKWSPTSMKFNGSTDYLTTPLGPNLQFGTSDFTVECWSYLISRVTTMPCIFNNYNNYTAGSLGFFAGHATASTTQYQVSINGGSFPSTAIQGGTIVYNNWVHLAVVRSSGVISLYVNGTSVGTQSSSASLNGVGSNFFIGTAGDTPTTSYINGYLQDFRITKGVARYTANFSVPTTPFSTR